MKGDFHARSVTECGYKTLLGKTHVSNFPGIARKEVRVFRDRENVRQSDQLGGSPVWPCLQC